MENNTKQAVLVAMLMKLLEEFEALKRKDCRKMNMLRVENPYMK